MIACLSVFFGILYLYSPALGGPFIFDDLTLPFSLTSRDWPLLSWISRPRPVLMFSYWLNFQFWASHPFSYHFVNLLIHCINAGLVFLVLSRLLAKAGWDRRKAMMASIAGSLVFLIHPLQTESVSYVAGRSESLASLFLLLAYVVFLYRRTDAISWREALLVLALFGLGLMTKQNAVSLVGILILTDVFWPTPFSMDGLRRNWRLYGLVVPGALAAAVVVVRFLATTQSAGFSLSTFKWYQYAFTEARALFTYIRMAILPFGQSVDQDYPPSHTIFEHGAIWYMILLAGLVAVAIVWRRRYPLFCFGLLMFLIWLAPTSSIIPIADPLVERRMYLPLLGLILIGCEVGSRLRLSRAMGVAVLVLIGLIFGKLCYDRNLLWGEPDKLLQSAADTSVDNPRPLLNYTNLLIRTKRCDLAPPYLERAERRLPHNYDVNAAWGRALGCLGRYDESIARFQTAAQIRPCSQVYEWLGVTYTNMGRLEQAGKVLKKAVELGPNSESAHTALAFWYEKVDALAAAEQEYRKALSLDRSDLSAQRRLIYVHEREAAREAAPSDAR